MRKNNNKTKDKKENTSAATKRGTDTDTDPTCFFGIPKSKFTMASNEYYKNYIPYFL